MRALAVVLLALGVGGAAPASAQPASDALAARVDAYMAPLVAAGQLSGTLLVATDGQVRYRRTVGAHTPGGEPLTASTPLYVASITKPVTLLLAVQLDAEGVLRLDQPVGRWLSGFAGGDVMTLDDLLRHRAGIPHRLIPDSARYQHRSMAELVDATARGPRDFPPGTAVRYSSGGYTVAAAVLERATGESFAQLLAARVTDPVGAAHTGDASTGPAPGGAWGQYLLPTGPVEAKRRNLSFLVGGGSMYATAGDLLLIVRGIVDGHYGVAVRSRLLDAQGSLAWDGATSGHRAFVRHEGATGTTVVFVGNLHTGAVNLLRQAVPRLARGEAVSPPDVRLPAALPAPEAERVAVEGRYTLGWDQPLRFRGSEVAWLGDWPLWYIGPGRFYWPQDFEALRVEHDATGVVGALVSDAGWRAPRVAAGAGP